MMIVCRYAKEHMFVNTLSWLQRTKNLLHTPHPASLPTHPLLHNPHNRLSNIHLNTPPILQHHSRATPPTHFPTPVHHLTLHNPCNRLRAQFHTGLPSTNLHSRFPHAILHQDIRNIRYSGSLRRLVQRLRVLLPPLQRQQLRGGGGVLDGFVRAFGGLIRRLWVGGGCWGGEAATGCCPCEVGRTTEGGWVEREGGDEG